MKLEKLNQANKLQKEIEQVKYQKSYLTTIINCKILFYTDKKDIENFILKVELDLNNVIKKLEKEMEDL